MVILELLNSDNDESVCKLPVGEHIIGRGDLLQCLDKRVSRKHAIIYVEEDSASIKSVHQNPCFYISCKGKSVSILTRDVPTSLRDGDKFALLPDKYWFKVKTVACDKTDKPSQNGITKVDGNLLVSSSSDAINNTTCNPSQLSSNLEGTSSTSLFPELDTIGNVSPVKRNISQSHFEEEEEDNNICNASPLRGEVSESNFEDEEVINVCNATPLKRNISQSNSEDEEGNKRLKMSDGSDNECELISAINDATDFNDLPDNTEQNKPNINEISLNPTADGEVVSREDVIKVENSSFEDIKEEKIELELLEESEDPTTSNNDNNNNDGDTSVLNEDTKDVKLEAPDDGGNPSTSRNSGDGTNVKDRRDRCWYGSNCFSSEETPKEISDSDYDSSEDHDDLYYESSEYESCEETTEQNDNQTEYQWSDVATQLKNIPFTGEPIPLNISDVNDPFEYFNLLATEEFYNLVVTKTNERAAKKQPFFKPAGLDEFKGFLGLLYLTGTITNEDVDDYWKEDTFFNNSKFRENMALDRYKTLLNCLHFSENLESETGVPTKRFHKAQPLLDYFNKRMAKMYYPDKGLCVNDSIVLWRKRFLFRQNLKHNRRRFPVTFYMLCEESGMVQKLLIDAQSETEEEKIVEDENIVYELLANKLNKGHSVYMDNYFNLNSLKLACGLLEKNTYVTGTLTAKQKNVPKDIIKAKIKRGELKVKYSRNVCLQKWREFGGDVLIVTTQHEAAFVTKTNKKGAETKEPKCISESRKFSSVEEKIGELVTFLPCVGKSLRLYQKIGIHVFQLVLFNSYYLFKKNTPIKLSLYDYRNKIIEYLLSYNNNFKKGEHVAKPMKVGGKKRSLQRRCKLCYAYGKHKDTIYYCASCAGLPALCLDCFPVFHKKK